MYNIAMLLCYLTLFRGDIHVHTQVATLKVNMAFGRKRGDRYVECESGISR